jgi:hypothetical protein
LLAITPELDAVRVPAGERVLFVHVDLVLRVVLEELLSELVTSK